MKFKAFVDKYVTDKNLKIPYEKEDTIEKENIETITHLNGKKENITSIIWSTGFQDDYSFLKVPVFDKEGQPIHEKGVSNIPGLYFIGLRWLSKYKSFLLCGVAEDAEYITGKINTT